MCVCVCVCVFVCNFYVEFNIFEFRVFFFVGRSPYQGYRAQSALQF